MGVDVNEVMKGERLDTNPLYATGAIQIHTQGPIVGSVPLSRLTSHAPNKAFELDPIATKSF